MEGILTNDWNPYPKVKPKDRQTCLVTWRSGFGFGDHIDIFTYSEDLYSVSSIDFENKKGKSGFYYSSGEWGYIDVDDSVLAWMPLPKPYVEK